MVDEPFQPIADPFEQPSRSAPPLTVTAQYLKDLSFESPNMPELLSGVGRVPQGLIKVDVNARRRHDDKLAYIAELQYGGLFSVGDVAPRLIEPMLLIEAPRLLFPFAREIVAGLIQQAGFRAMLIHPIDFAMHFREQRARGGGPTVN
jgi:preprotein translocase subunit SecB